MVYFRWHPKPGLDADDGMVVVTTSDQILWLPSVHLLTSLLVKRIISAFTARFRHQTCASYHKFSHSEINSGGWSKILKNPWILQDFCQNAAGAAHRMPFRRR
jgi:hypothetical protein